jgi:twitching motility protein PilJ
MKANPDSAILSILLNNTARLGFIVAFVVFILAFLGITVFVQYKTDQDAEYISNAGELRVLSQQVAKNAVEAAAGKEEAFRLLQSARTNFETRWGYVSIGNKRTGLPASPVDGIAELQALWGDVRGSADRILETQDTVLSLHEVAATLSETIPQLQVEYDEVVEILLDNDAPADQVAVGQRQ